VIDSIINYDMSDALQHVFQVIDPTVPLGPNHGPNQHPYDQPVTHYVDAYRNAAAMFKDVGALVNFVSVHDQPRWMYLSPDTRTYKNAFVATFFLPGIPINYYGDEQGVRGGNTDDTCRSPLWRTGYDQSHPLYLFTKSVISARKHMLKSLSDVEVDDVKHLTGTDYSFSFQRGPAVVVVEKVLPAAISDFVINVGTEYKQGTVLCDSLQDGQYCITVGEGGLFRYTLSGLPKVLLPVQNEGVDLGMLTANRSVPTWALLSLIAVCITCLLVGAYRSAKSTRGDEMKTSYLALA